MIDALDFTAKPTVLVVDDTTANLILVAELLKKRYKVKVASDGAKALSIIQSGDAPDLILLDIMMPELSGYEVCQRLKSDPATRDIPIIFLTALTNAEDERKGFELGAADYITKPVSPPILMARVKTHLQIKAVADFLRDRVAYLEKEVAELKRHSPGSADSIATMAQEFRTVSERLSGPG